MLSVTNKLKSVKTDWPGGAHFAICLTHDVDRVRKTKFHSVYYLIKEPRLRHISSILNEQAAYWNFDKIIAVEEKYDVRSTFFFLNEQDLFRDRPARSLLNPREWVMYYSSYRVDDPPVKNLIGDLSRESWEIGLHGSYQSCERGDLLLKEKQTLETVLGQRVIGVRQHYLRLKIPDTWKLQREVGFEYDSSYGAQQCVEVQEKWMRPFYPFGEGFLEIPVTIMDGYLFRTCGSNMNLAWKRCLSALEFAKKNHGVVTIIWHSQQFNEDEFHGWPKIYEKILVTGKKMKAWMATAGQVYEVLGHAGD